MSFETGKIGRQASGSVVARINDTMILSTACADREVSDLDYSPLRVDFFARFSSVGRTSGAYHRRDCRGDDNEILVSRLIDRPLRPMIPQNWKYETQILTWLLSYDKSINYEPLAISAASAALAISEIPYFKPIAGVEVGLINGELVVCPNKSESMNSKLHLVIAGNRDGVLMIEGSADFVPDEIFAAAIEKGHSAIRDICSAIENFQKLAGKPKRENSIKDPPIELLKTIEENFGDQLLEAISISSKQSRGAAVAAVEEKIINYFKSGILDVKKEKIDIRLQPTEDLKVIEMNESNNLDEDNDDVILSEEDIIITSEEPSAEDEASELQGSRCDKILDEVTFVTYTPVDVKVSIKKALAQSLRRLITQTGRRPDGRVSTEVRPISVDTSILPTTHGSALFTRGETQVISTVTLGSKSMEAKSDSVDFTGTKRFYLQYKFPPSSTGDVGRVTTVSRREVGHGNLAERALLPSLPTSIDFPYSLRSETLVTESCGSSSMATVCGSSLALLDAGVPISSLVAGIAMGLIEGDDSSVDPIILTDILGLEDALGSMDFKVAGNEHGLTTFQLDMKSSGLQINTLEKAIRQARVGRLHVLEIMRQHLNKPRIMKESIPIITCFHISPDLHRKIIGPRGKTIQSIIENTGVEDINLADDGYVYIESVSEGSNNAAKRAILQVLEEAKADDTPSKIFERKELQNLSVGSTYINCEITGVTSFGVFVEVFPGVEALVHVSELDVKRIEDPAKEGFTTGQYINVKCIGVNNKGQYKLSRKACLTDAKK